MTPQQELIVQVVKYLGFGILQEHQQIHTFGNAPTIMYTDFEHNQRSLHVLLYSLNYRKSDNYEMSHDRFLNHNPGIRESIGVDLIPIFHPSFNMSLYGSDLSNWY